jgi:cytochrome c1
MQLRNLQVLRLTWLWSSKTGTGIVTTRDAFEKDVHSENYARGKIYYGYYCSFCHGDKGDGFGPVGYSYNPVPADLHTAKIQSMSDGELLYAMLTGTGHAPCWKE